MVDYYDLIPGMQVKLVENIKKGRYGYGYVHRMMEKYSGEIVTVRGVYSRYITILEDAGDAISWAWWFPLIEYVVNEEEEEKDIEDFQFLSILSPSSTL